MGLLYLNGQEMQWGGIAESAPLKVTFRLGGRLAMLSGRATSEGTAHYFNSRQELGGWLEACGLHCSRIGFGSYRVGDQLPTQTGALKAALMSGCNLIDTSTNYGDGASERAIGRALGELASVGVVNREQIVVVSKIGYVQGQALDAAKRRKSQGQGFSQMVEYHEDCWHCIHPDYLDLQLGLSLERLGLECLDFLLLHNPEYFLMDTARRGASKMLPGLRDEYYERIRLAFEYLEGQVAAGRIQGYGVSSNTFGAPHSRADATSVARVWEAAREVGQKMNSDPGQHRFRIIQLPLNLLESGAVLEPYGTDGLSTLEFATKHGLGVLANRPLNAFTRQQLVRLADFPVQKATGDLAPLIQNLADLEEEFNRSVGPLLQAMDASTSAKLFRWAEDLGQVESIPLGADKWSQIEEQIATHVTGLCNQINSQLNSEAWSRWQNAYMPALGEVLHWLRNQANLRSQKQSDTVSSRLDPLLPDEWKAASLSQKALGIVMHTPGVSCVLNGMRHPDYVHDSMGTTKLLPLDEPSVMRAYKAFMRDD